MAKEQNSSPERAARDIEELNKAFTGGYSRLSDITTGTDHSNELNRIDNSINELIRSELNNTKSITSDDMSTFLVKLFNDLDRGVKVESLDDIFEGEDNSLVQFFQDRYHNRNLYFEDLSTICEQLFEMDEAIMTTRDAIITSDDISHDISRTLSFNNITDSSEVSSYVSTVEELENKFSLPKKIKNHIIPNTLKYGTYYVYVIPYAKLFEQQSKHYNEDLRSIGSRNVREAFVSESFDADFVKDLKAADTSFSGTNPKNLSNVMDKFYENVSVLNDVCSIPLVEGTDLSGIYSDELFRGEADKTIKKSNSDTGKYSDGVYGNNKVENFDDTVTDCYIRYIDPRQIIPVTVLDTVIGYYYVHESELQVNKAPFSNTIRVTNSTSPGLRSEDVEAVFLSKITDKIVASFDKKFVQKNQKFKDLILNSLIYNDIYNKQLTFQFIPRDYIVEFSVNPDESGNGTSVLKKSLFYAKLYLALLIFKMVSIINRSTDMRVYYIRNSGLDNNMTNALQDAARSIKGRQINFMDLLNYNSIISRIGHNKELFIPTGRSGEKSIDFDILQGQDIPLNTDLMEMLRTNMINGTGVPSIIMNYINEADYAKTIQMGHAKFVGRTISEQLDFNPDITLLYQKIMKFSGVSIPEEYIGRFSYTLNPPKTLNNVNSSDTLSVADQVVTAIIKSKIGESDNDETTAIVKDKMYDSLIREFLPMIDWHMVDDIYKDSRIKAVEELNNKPKQEQ